MAVTASKSLGILKRLDPALIVGPDVDDESGFFWIPSYLDGPSEQAAPSETPADTMTFQRLRVGGSSSSALEVSFDQDWYHVWLVAGVTYQIALNGSGATPLPDPVVRLLDSFGIQLAADDDGGDGLNSLLTFTPGTTGTYFVSAQAFGNYAGEYTVSLTETDIAPDTTTTATVTADGFVRGTLENITYFDPLLDQYVTRYDEDWYRVDVQAGQRYHFLWSKAGINGPRGVDLSLYDANGALLYTLNTGADWDWGYIDWTPPTSGTWFLGVSGAATSGEYTISVNRLTDSPLEAIDGVTKVPINNIEVYFAQAGETFHNITSEGWNAYEAAQAMAALARFSNIANLTFTQTTVQADAEFTLVLDDDQLGALGAAGRFYFPGSWAEGIGQINGNYGGWSTAPGGGADPGGDGWETLLHEFGHGLGLTHPHDDGMGSWLMNGVSAATGDYGDFDLNQGVYTVMSYNSSWATAPHGLPRKPDGKLNPNFGWDGTPMAFDVAVIQQKYGANMSYRTGNDIYTLPSADQAGTFYSCIWDAGGNDTIRAGATTLACTIDLRAATLRYEVGGGGWISYHTSIHGGFTIANGVVIENATGGAGNDRLTGNAADNILNGGLGADRMTGGLGNDQFYVDNAGDTIFDGVGEGVLDRVFATVSYTLTAGAQIEIISTTNHAGTDPINLTGNELSQSIQGNAAANILDGRGGADAMVGRAGDDWFFVDNTGDTVNDGVGEGAQDRVFAKASFVLNGGAQIEIISTTDHAGTLPINLSGNEFGQTLQGNAGANTLDGRGGADVMTGRAGNDWYYVDNAGDRATEASGEGIDQVFASVSFALEAGAEIEYLRTTNDAGTAAIGLTGNEFVQIMYGNAGNNILDGKGGADAMVGRAGNDFFYVDNASDTVNDGVGEGTADRVFAAVSYTLGAANVEILSTTTSAGTGAIDLTGNALGQTIYGNNGANIINGGAGNDTLQGFAGADIYLFNTALNAMTNVDTITGYSVSQNVIRLENAIFTGLANGALAAGAFRIGAAAGDADDRIIYNAATGALIFDANGNGAGGATQFATLATGLAMTAAEFFVV